ncbi:hypothetical protein STAQ_37060 [Allostella sp. ATCC 35155]|nr:hypothetical protein STAQ_37060 [Stella sp. ATCC 35155]
MGNIEAGSEAAPPAAELRGNPALAPVSRSGPGLRILSAVRLAAGNVLGDRPALAVVFDAPAGTVCDPGAVGRLMADVAPDLGDEYRLARLPPDADPLAAALAAVLVAFLANGRDLPVAVTRAAAAPGRDAWSICLAEGVDGAPRELFDVAADLLRHALRRQPVLPALRARIEAMLGSRLDRYDRNQRNLLIEALAADGIGWRRCLDHPIGMVGEGRRRRRLRGGVSPHTTLPGGTLAERKDEASARLAAAGLPVARQVRVADAAAACAAAERLGYPVVVKPVDCSNGRGVAIGLSTPGAVAAAFADARRRSAAIVVETQLVGHAYRLLVIRGEVAGAIRNAPGTVVGDGRRTIRELVAAADAAPPRQGPRAAVRPLRLTDEMLAYLRRCGRDGDTILAAGESATLHWHGHMSRGAIARTVGDIHPDNREAACQAAAVIGLDVAGIDMIVPDIALSWRGTGGGICEVNRAPGFRTHSIAEGRVAAALTRFAAHVSDGRPMTVPIVVFLGGRERDAPALAMADRLAGRGLAIGLATTRRFEAAGLPLADPGPGSPLRVARLIDDPAVDAIVAVVDPAAVVAEGFGHGRADLAILPDDGPCAAGDILAGIGAVLVPPAALPAAIDDGLLARIVALHRAPT